MTRKRLRANIEEAVLVQSRRRCSICFGLNRDIGVKVGQIAHLDRKNSNDALANLAFLCVEHHDAYDSTTRQSKGFRAREVRTYRAELYRSVIPVLEARAASRAPSRLHRRRNADVERNAPLGAERRAALLELIANADAIRGHASLAHKLGLTTRTTERILAQLANDGVVRIDREHGTLKKTYSLPASPTNRLIDTFIDSIGENVVSEMRYVRKRLTEVAAIVKAPTHSYVIDTLLVASSASRALIARRVRELTAAKRELGLNRAQRVLLIGITQASTLAGAGLKDFENGGLVVRYVDLGPA